MVKRLLASEYHRLFYSSWQLGKNNTVSIAFDIEGPLNCEILSQVIDKLVIEQPFLRTTFTEINGTLYQDIHEQGKSQLATIFLSHSSSCVNTAVNDYYQQPFNLQTLPLAKFYLLRLPSNRFKFILLNNHIIADSVVAHFLVRYIEQTYNAMVLGKKIPTFTTSSMNEYIDHEINTLTQHKKNTSIAFWETIFSNDQYSLNWSSRLSLSQPHDHQQNTHYFALSKQQSSHLITLATALSTTPFIVISSLFAYLLSRYTYSNHFYLSYPINMRPKAFHNLLGCLINTSVLAINIDHSFTLTEWIATLQKFRQASKPHTFLPYPELYTLFQQTNQQTPSPLTQAAVIPGADLSAVAPSLYQCRTVGAPLNLNMPYSVALSYQHDEVFTFRFEDPAGHLTKQQSQLFCDQWLDLLQKTMDDPHCRLQDIRLLSSKKIHRHIQRDIPKQITSDVLNNSLDSSFIHIAKRFPNHIAITNTETSYQQLLNRMAQWSYTIQRMLPQLAKNSLPIVGLCCSRTPHMIELQLALLHCGYIVMPLNPDDPSQRLKQIMQQSQSTTLIYDSKIIHQHNQIISSGQWNTLQIDSEAITALISQQPTELLKPINKSSAAYLMHTSGSTGQPKGIMVSHASLLTLQRSMHNEYPTDHQDVWSCFHSLAFDVSLFEIWGALLTGASLLIASEHARTDVHEFHQNLLDNQVSVLSQTPRVFELLMDYDIQIQKRIPSLRWIFLAGDRVDVTPIEQWWSSFTEPHPPIINLYGTTETTVHATHQQLSPHCELDQQGLIGKPLDHLVAVVLDNAGQIAEPGMMGEIALAGKHCAQSYWNHNAKSKTSFISSIDLSIFGLPKATRLYRTGDLGYWNDHYQLYYVGRYDHQIKRHGYRIELGEIEQAMQLHPKALRVAVTLDKSGTTHRLIAWFQTTSEGTTISRTQWLQHLQALLPHYMWPDEYQQQAHLSLNSQGKIDRKKIRLKQCTVYREHPLNAQETLLIRLWAKALGLETIGIDDNFFHNGGNSIKSIQLTHLAAEQQILLSPHEIMECPTIASWIATYGNPQSSRKKNIEQQAMEYLQAPILSFNTNSKNSPIFIIHPGAGGPLDGCIELAQSLSPSAPIYIFDSYNLYHLDTPKRTLKSLAEHYKKALYIIQPEGPYRLLGWSLGGAIAYAMAEQLQSDHHHVSHLVLIDSDLPTEVQAKVLAKFDDQTSYQQVLTEISSITDPFSLSILSELMLIEYQLFNGFKPKVLTQTLAFLAKATHPLEVNHPVVNQILSRYRKILNRPDGGFSHYLANLTIHPYSANHMSIMEPPVLNQLANDLSHFLMKNRLSNPSDST